MARGILRKTAIAATACGGLLASSASADFIALPGARVLDTDTCKEWNLVWVQANYNYNQMQAQLDSGPYGWRYATRADLEELFFVSAEIPNECDQCQPILPRAAKIHQFMEAFGDTRDDWAGPTWHRREAEGRFGEAGGQGHLTAGVFYQEINFQVWSAGAHISWSSIPDYGSDNITGHWIVRDSDIDSDSDGIRDCDDACPGSPDSVDADADGIPDDCDSCPNDASNDADGDGVCGALDRCPGANDLLDCNANQIPDGCDLEHPGAQQDFESAGGGVYQLNGVAIVSNGECQLTQATQSTTGTVVFEPVTDAPVGEFEAEFDIRISGGTGADGMSFAILPTVTNSASALFGENGGSSSLAVKFDTYRNGTVEPSSNFVDVRVAGVSVATYQPTFSLRNAPIHVTVSFVEGALTVTLTRSGGSTEIAFDALALPTYVPQVARYGFGARTGSLTNQHVVDSVRFVVTSTSGDCNSNSVPDTCDADADSDGVIDDCDSCPDDPEKTEPGACGCGTPDTDTDSDGIADCLDECPNDATNQCNACLGDVTGDNQVNLSDLSVLLANFGVSSGATAAQGDLTHEGAVDLSDLSILLGRFGATCD